MSLLSNAIKKDISILDYAKLNGYTPEKIGNQYTLKEMDSIRILADKNIFYRHSSQIGGSIIDFAMMISGNTLDESIKELRAMLPNFYNKETYLNYKNYTNTPTPPKELVIPNAINTKYSRVFAYLTKSRYIDKSIVEFMVKNKYLYEDEKHNCVFLGRDYDGNIKYASLRSSSTNFNFKGDARGSDKSVGLYINNNSNKLFVNEAIIDSMSIMTMLKINNLNFKDYNYFSMGGVTTKGLLYHLKNPNIQKIQTIYIASDNDESGNQVRESIRNLLKENEIDIKIIDKKPKGKDFNEDLVSLKTHVQENTKVISY